jgi:hypothetical protein
MPRSHDKLLKGIRARIASGKPTECGAPKQKPRPVASAKAVKEAETKLGRALQPLLRRVYLEVANGGFGPDYGLLGIPPDGAADGKHTALDLWSRFGKPRKADPHWAWPSSLFPLGHMGCGMYMCLDLDAAVDASMIWFEPNPHSAGEPWDDSFIAINGSLEDWLSRWVEGGSLFGELLEKAR